MGIVSFVVFLHVVEIISHDLLDVDIDGIALLIEVITGLIIKLDALLLEHLIDGLHRHLLLLSRVFV